MILLEHVSASERRRTIVSFGVGALGAAVAAPFVAWQLWLVIGWTISATWYLISVWSDVAHLDARETLEAATREDNSRAAARILTLSSSVASLVTVLFGLARASSAATPLEVALIVMSLATLITSWAVIHCVFTLRYAHLYYSEPIGGIDFPGDDSPTFRDFAYLAFTVGMTYQVADTDITNSTFRRALLGHALLSYVFGAAIIAVAINVVASLV